MQDDLQAKTPLSGSAVVPMVSHYRLHPEPVSSALAAEHTGGASKYVHEGYTEIIQGE